MEDPAGPGPGRHPGRHLPRVVQPETGYGRGERGVVATAAAATVATQGRSRRLTPTQVHGQE